MFNIKRVELPVALSMHMQATPTQLSSLVQQSDSMVVVISTTLSSGQTSPLMEGESQMVSGVDYT